MYVCVREKGGGETEKQRKREVRFTHAPTIMPSWRVEYILYIIQECAHTQSQHAQVVCFKKEECKR